MEIQSKKSIVKKKLGEYFHKIFSPSHIAYTIIFIIELFVLISFNFVAIVNIGDVGIFLATTFALSFIFLMLLGIFSKLESQLFSKALDKRKLMYFLLVFGISFIIVLLYFIFGQSNQLLIQFLGWDFILPGFYIIIYFGWNLAQIFFLRKPFEDISMKINNKAIQPKQESKRNQLTSIIFLIIALIFPILAQLGTYFAFFDYFSPDPTSLAWFNGWNFVMYLIILLTSYRLIYLFLKSIANKSANTLSSAFYFFIWLILWYRSFSFINSFRSASTAYGIDAFRVVIDIFLMVITAIIVLRGLGSKVYKIRLFNPNNLAFFLYAFTIIYFEGQIVMITGAGSIVGSYADRNQINLVNNFLILMISLIFYWYYSKYILEKHGLIIKQLYKQSEVIEIIEDFKDYLINTGAIDSNKIDKWELDNYLKKKRLRTD
ncbi:MAG: hypothetical protein ACFFKA_16965 [Candidatus Thorarchaeota archaeon]